MARRCRRCRCTADARSPGITVGVGVGVGVVSVVGVVGGRFYDGRRRGALLVFFEGVDPVLLLLTHRE